MYLQHHRHERRTGIIKLSSEHSKLIIHLVTFEVTQSIWPRYINVSDRRTDGQTDGQRTVAITLFVLLASRGNKTETTKIMMLICCILNIVLVFCL